MANGRAMSNAERARAAMLMDEGDRARTIIDRGLSDADRARAAMIMGEGGRAISDADRMLLRYLKKYLKDNDGPSKPKKTKMR